MNSMILTAEQTLSKAKAITDALDKYLVLFPPEVHQMKDVDTMTYLVMALADELDELESNLNTISDSIRFLKAHAFEDNQDSPMPD